MADIGKSMRSLFLSGVKAVNSAASSLASTTRYKVDEMNLQNRRREVLNSVSQCAWQLWTSGVELPEELKVLMLEIEKIDEELEEMREAQKEQKDKKDAPEEPAAEEDTAPVLDIPDEGPYAQAAREQAEAEADAGIDSKIEDALGDIKRAVKDAADAVSDAFNGPEKDDDPADGQDGNG